MPNIEVTLLAEEQQAQRDADDLVKALKDMNRNMRYMRYLRTSDEMCKPCGKSMRWSSARQM